MKLATYIWKHPVLISKAFMPQETIFKFFTQLSKMIKLYMFEREKYFLGVTELKNTHPVY